MGGCASAVESPNEDSSMDPRPVERAHRTASSRGDAIPVSSLISNSQRSITSAQENGSQSSPKDIAGSSRDRTSDSPPQRARRKHDDDYDSDVDINAPFDVAPHSVMQLLSPEERKFLGRCRSTGGAVGLRNLGNTCFFSSALQCLLHTRPLAEYFLLGRDESERKLVAQIVKKAPKGMPRTLGASVRTAEAFAELVRTAWGANGSTGGAVLSPSHLKASLALVNRRFESYDQQDAQECLSYLLDALHEGLNRAAPGRYTPSTSNPAPPVVKIDDRPGRPIPELAAEYWYSHLCRNQSVIVDAFQAQLQSTLTCLSCGTQSTTFDPYLYLSLPLRDNRGGICSSVQEALETFTDVEVLPQKEGWRCPSCKVPRAAKKQFSIWSLPNVLIVHLKRFTNSWRKLDNFVDFPMVWDLSAHVKGTSAIPQSNVMELYGVVNHYGSMSGGHYTAFCRAPNRNRVDSSDSDLWTYFDDSHSKQGYSETHVRSSAAYLLFYRRKVPGGMHPGIESIRPQSLSSPHLWPHAAHALPVDVREKAMKQLQLLSHKAVSSSPRKSVLDKPHSSASGQAKLVVRSDGTTFARPKQSEVKPTPITSTRHDNGTETKDSGRISQAIVYSSNTQSIRVTRAAAQPESTDSEDADSEDEGREGSLGTEYIETEDEARRRYEQRREAAAAAAARSASAAPYSYSPASGTYSSGLTSSVRLGNTPSNSSTYLSTTVGAGHSYPSGTSDSSVTFYANRRRYMDNNSSYSLSNTTSVSLTSPATSSTPSDSFDIGYIQTFNRELRQRQRATQYTYQ